MNTVNINTSYSIYVLHKNGVVFYVGLSSDVGNRFYYHKRTFGDGISYLIIESGIDASAIAFDRENFWIDHYISIGCILENKKFSKRGKVKLSADVSYDVYRKAKIKVAEEGTTLSSKIEFLLIQYVNS